MRPSSPSGSPATLSAACNYGAKPNPVPSSDAYRTVDSPPETDVREPGMCRVELVVTRSAGRPVNIPPEAVERASALRFRTDPCPVARGEKTEIN